MKLILASTSRTRALILGNAGIAHDCVAPNVDEASIRDALRAEGASVAKQADLLAETKALRVSQKHPGVVVLGCDQMLEIEGEALDKPASRDEARGHLIRLRGKTHTLETAIVACVDGAPVWRHLAKPKLTMRAFSDDFLEDYLWQAGDKVMTSVGAYQLEGIGAQLFSRIEGDYFSILGLPLLPLTGWLRDRGDLAS